MKFTKPINREVEIDGQNFIVAFDDSGIEFRLKGKRKTARVAWTAVLDIARGEDGEDARTLLGLGASSSASQQRPAHLAQNEDALSRSLNPPAPQSQPDGSAQAPPSTAASSANPSSPDTSSSADHTAARGEQGTEVTAGDFGPES
jgi:hypothetical protein